MISELNFSILVHCVAYLLNKEFHFCNKRSTFVVADFFLLQRYFSTTCQEKAKFHREGRLLQDAKGHLYRLTQTYKAEPSKKYWRCSWFRRKGLGCMAKAVTHGDWIVKKSCIHNHPLEMPGIFE